MTTREKFGIICNVLCSFNYLKQPSHHNHSISRDLALKYNVSIVLAGPWFSRGGNNDNDSVAGVFTSNYLVGRADGIASSHLVFIS